MHDKRNVISEDVYDQKQAPSAALPAGTRSPSGAAVTRLFILALLVCVYLAHPLLVPVVAAFYLKLVLTPVVRKLWVWGVPPLVGAALVVGACLIGMALSVYQLSGPANEWLRRSPGIARQLNSRLQEWKAPVESVSEAAEEVEAMTEVDRAPNPEVNVRDRTLVSYFFESTGSLFTTAVFTTVLL